MNKSSGGKPSSSRSLSIRDVFRSSSNFIALGFGSGLSPFAPGTAGTLAAIPFYLLLLQLPSLLYLSALLIAFMVGVRVCERAAKSLNVHDHPGIVWDEMLGLWIALYSIPFSWGAVLLGFLLFRLFDIVKPWPIRSIDRKIGGGIGIMLDDVVAGVFANILLNILLRIFGW